MADIFYASVNFEEEEVFVYRMNTMDYRGTERVLFQVLTRYFRGAEERVRAPGFARLVPEGRLNLAHV